MHARTRPISSFLDQTSLVNDFLYFGQKEKFFLMELTQEISSGHDGALR